VKHLHLLFKMFIRIILSCNMITWRYFKRVMVKSTNIYSLMVINKNKKLKIPEYLYLEAKQSFWSFFLSRFSSSDINECFKGYVRAEEPAVTLSEPQVQRTEVSSSSCWTFGETVVNRHQSSGPLFHDPGGSTISQSHPGVNSPGRLSSLNRRPGPQVLTQTSMSAGTAQNIQSFSISGWISSIKDASGSFPPTSDSASMLAFAHPTYPQFGPSRTWVDPLSFRPTETPVFPFPFFSSGPNMRHKLTLSSFLYSAASFTAKILKILQFLLNITLKLAFMSTYKHLSLIHSRKWAPSDSGLHQQHKQNTWCSSREVFLWSADSLRD